jgi:hypothetical protein
MENSFDDPAERIEDLAERDIWRIFGDLPVYSEDDYLNLSRRDRFVFDLWWYDRELLNGGMWSYFYNSIGDHWPACLPVHCPDIVLRRCYAAWQCHEKTVSAKSTKTP